MYGCSMSNGKLIYRIVSYSYRLLKNKDPIHKRLVVLKSKSAGVRNTLNVCSQ